MPAGYSSYLVAGEDIEPAVIGDGYQFRLTAENPDAALAIYNVAPGR